MPRLIKIFAAAVAALAWPREQERRVAALGRAVVLQQKQIDALEARVGEFDVRGEPIGDARGA